MTTLGTKIRKLRELKNISQVHMAEQIGMSQSSYARIEKDEGDVSRERLEQISKALDLTVQDILAFDEKQVFNFNNSQGGQGVLNNPVFTMVADNERKLYEDKIRLLEDMVEMQKQEIERLKKGK